MIKDNRRMLIYFFKFHEFANFSKMCYEDYFLLSLITRKFDNFSFNANGGGCFLLSLITRKFDNFSFNANGGGYFLLKLILLSLLI